MAGVDLERVSKTFGTTAVLKDVSLSVRDGEFLTLVGASGCGKSTILRVIAGLEPQDRGTVKIGARPVDHLRPKQRDVAMVFQSYALYPHMSVGENIAMPLVMQRFGLIERMPGLGHLSPRRGRLMTAINAEVEAVARQLQIEALLGRKPSQLSGGQRQRVALGRAMVRRPDVFLMDEPLSNLDAKLRVHMRAELSDLHRRLGVTFIYVTHDQVEAMTMATRVALMDEGRIVQLGTPAELYHDPADLRVARFIGSPAVNVFRGQAGASGVTLAGVTLPVDSGEAPGTPLQIAIRPEALALGAQPGRPGLQARVAHVENLGAEVFLHFQPFASSGLPVILRVGLETFEQHRGHFDGEVTLALDPHRVMLFDEGGARLRRGAASRQPVGAPVALTASAA